MTRNLCRNLFAACLVLVALLLGACNTNQSPRQQVDDAAIAAEVKSKLAADVDLSTVTDIDVNVTNGVVTLAGQVASDGLRRRAEEVARTVDGVVRVSNNLQVQPGV